MKLNSPASRPWARRGTQWMYWLSGSLWIRAQSRPGGVSHRVCSVGAGQAGTGARRVERGDAAKLQREEFLRKFVEGHEETAVRAQHIASGAHGGAEGRRLVGCFEQGGAQGEAGLQKAGGLGFSHGKQAWGRLERVQVGDHLPDLFLAQHACPTHHGCPRLAFADAPEQVIISHLGRDDRQVGRGAD